MSLSSLIVQREVATIRQVEEALARQVLYGGDLVTNLMEVVQIPESVLVPLLAEAVGMTAAPLGMLPPPTPQARALVPEDVAARRVVMPLSVEADRLVLAVSEPLGRDELEELSFALGVRIDERIAPSVRIREALARVYGVPLERRMARLVGRLAGVDPTVPNSLPPLAAPRATFPPLPGVLVHDIPRLNPPGMPVLGTMRLPDSRGVIEERRAEHARPAGTSSSSDLRAVLPTLIRESKAPPEVTRRRGPVTLDQVTDELPTLTDRDGLLNLFFAFARQFFEYSAIFVVHGDIAEGRDSFGPGAPRERVLAIGVPLDMPGLLRTVKERAAPVCAFAELGGVDAVLLGDLKRDIRARLLVVPVVVRSRVVAFLVADDGESGIEPSAQGEVTAVAALVGREFERLIVRMKLQGFSADTAGREARVDHGRLARVTAKPRRLAADFREAGAQALEQAVTASAPPPPFVDTPEPPSPEPPPPPEPSAPDDAPAVESSEDVTDQIVENGDRDAESGVRLSDASDDLLGPEEGVTGAVIELVARRSPTRPDLPMASTRPGALSAGALPAPATGAPPPRPRATLQTFPSPSPEEIDAATQRMPNAAPMAPADGDAADADGLAPISERSQLLAADLTPPPPQAVAVRRPSGRPIPREEVDDDGVPVSSTRLEHLSSRPPPADLRQARLLREIDALTARLSHSPPASKAAPASRAGQSVNVPPHHPPPSSRPHEPLPSVIVDESLQTDRLVGAFIANPRDEQVEAELLRLGQAAMPSIMKHFPGPLTITRATLDDTWPRATECGPILRLIAGQRRVALPFVLARTEDTDNELRFWATYLLTELTYVEAIPAVVARLFDDSKRVRRAARLVAHILGEIAAASLVAELDRIVRDTKASSARRIVTLDALGEMRDPLVVPVLLNTMGDPDEEVAMTARKALLLVTRQDFGRDAKKWVAWWQANAVRHRIEWLIDALTHDVPAQRRAAGQELKAITEQYFGYYDDLPKKDREKAQQKYRDWWRAEGMARFRKS